MLVYFEVAPGAVEDLVLALGDYMLLQLAESLCCATAAEEGAAYYHVTLTLLNVRKSVLQLEYLVAMAALDSDLIDDVIEVSVLLFRVELALALAALALVFVLRSESYKMDDSF